MAPAGEKKRFGFMRRGKPEADLTAEADGEKAPSGESSSLVPPLSRDKDEKPPGDTAEPSTPKDEPPPPKPATPRTPREEVNGAGVESADVEAASSADGTGETAARATDTPGGTVTDSTAPPAVVASPTADQEGAPPGEGDDATAEAKTGAGRDAAVDGAQPATTTAEAPAPPVDSEPLEAPAPAMTLTRLAGVRSTVASAKQKLAKGILTPQEREAQRVAALHRKKIRFVDDIMSRRVQLGHVLHGREVPRHRLGGRVRACGRRPDARHARAPQVDAGRAHSEVGAIGASYRRRHYT